MTNVVQLTITAKAYTRKDFDSAYEGVAKSVGHRPEMRIRRPEGAEGQVTHFVVLTTTEDQSVVQSLINYLEGK